MATARWKKVGCHSRRRRGFVDGAGGHGERVSAITRAVRREVGAAAVVGASLVPTTASPARPSAVNGRAVAVTTLCASGALCAAGFLPPPPPLTKLSQRIAQAARTASAQYMRCSFLIKSVSAAAAGSSSPSFSRCCCCDDIATVGRPFQQSKGNLERDPARNG